MAITLFTIQNNTGSPLGPYGQGQITIAANSTLAIQPPLNGLIADNNFILDYLSGNLSILLGSNPYAGPSIFQFFALLASHEFSNNFKNVTGNGTTTVKSGSGILHAVIVGNNSTNGTITIYDNTAGSGTVIMSLSLGSPSGGLLSTTGEQGPVYLNALNLGFVNGLTIVTTGSANNNVTLIYQ